MRLKTRLKAYCVVAASIYACYLLTLYRRRYSGSSNNNNNSNSSSNTSSDIETVDNRNEGSSSNDISNNSSSSISNSEGRVPGRRVQPWFLRGDNASLRFVRDSDFWSDTPRVYPDHGKKPGVGRNRDRMLEQLTLIPEDHDSNPVKTIYLANPWPKVTKAGGVGKYLEDEGCHVTKCDDTKDAETADMILVKGDFSAGSIRRRHPKQLLLYWQMECPLHSRGPTEESPMDWSSVPRGDATVPASYGKWVYYDENVRSLEQETNFAEGKTKKAAWFVSHCGTKSKREVYVEQLKQYLDVDVFGACGDKKCPRTDEAACDEMLRKDYKFYLAFENALCQDYVTEKLFNHALRSDVLPVVMGATRSELENWVPDGSFVHVDDFAGPKELAEHLNKLDADDQLYNEYFKWKGTGELLLDRHFWCRVCTMLHAPDNEDKYLRKEGTHEWYQRQGVCRKSKYGA